jgi:hypothetical protein
LDQASFVHRLEDSLAPRPLDCPILVREKDCQHRRGGKPALALHKGAKEASGAEAKPVDHRLVVFCDGLLVGRS